MLRISVLREPKSYGKGLPTLTAGQFHEGKRLSVLIASAAIVHVDSQVVRSDAPSNCHSGGVCLELDVLLLLLWRIQHIFVNRHR